MSTAAKGERAWWVSSLFYRFADTAASDQADDDLLAVLASRLPKAVVFDCGAGPGRLTEKLLTHPVGQVAAVDANPLMVAQARRRPATGIGDGRARVVEAYVDPAFFDGVALDPRRRPDICIFKRSLYSPEAEAAQTIAAAVAALRPGGLLAVVHPERSLRRYVFGDPPRFRSYSLFHLFNRIISVLAVRLRLSSSYRTYRADELVDLLTRAAPDNGHRVTTIASVQASYTVAVLDTRSSTYEPTVDIGDAGGRRS